MSPKLVDNGGHGAEDLWFTSRWDVALVVNKDGIQQRWNKVFPNLEEDKTTNQNGGRESGARYSICHCLNIYRFVVYNSR